jgi:type I site-specific restriction-modification system R (restriction) subunit
MPHTQAEQDLENKLVEQLVGLGYEKVVIRDERYLLKNLKRQLETHNNKTLSDSEFEKVLHHLNRGTVFDRAGILRDKISGQRELVQESLSGRAADLGGRNVQESLRRDDPHQWVAAGANRTETPRA